MTQQEPLRCWTADRLDTRLRQGRLGADHLRAVARNLACFHATARCDAEVARHATPLAVSRRVRECCDSLRSIAPASLDARIGQLEAQLIQAVERFADRVPARLDSGRIREGHGGLRLERIYVDAASRTAWSPPQSDLASRAADVCADIAVLARQLALHGRRDLAECWLAAYADAAQDYEIYLLLDLYEGLAAVELAQEIAHGSGDALGPTELGCRLRAALALDRPTLPARILVVGGLDGTGRSTLAERIATELRAPVIAAGRTGDEREVIRRAELVLASHRPVVVDGGFRSRADRSALRAVASARDIPFLFVECRTDAALRAHRLHGRAAAGETRGTSPPAGSREGFEPVDELPREAHLVVDTSKHPSFNTAIIRQILPLRLRRVLRHDSAVISAG